MAQILDKQGLQHYANKMCNADNRKVGSKSLPTALNDIDTAIDGFKTLFESEYGTPINMELTNNQNMFTVGTNTDIDKKDDVENSFTDLKIGGNTLVNLMPSITGKSFRFNANSNWITSVYRTTTQCLKPSTVYTIILDIYANNLSSTNNFHVNVEYNNLMAFTEKWVVNGIGRYVKAFTTKSNLTENMIVPRTQIEKAEEGKYVDYSIILLEGDWTNKPLPQHFNGMLSVSEVQNNNIKLLSQTNKPNLMRTDFSIPSAKASSWGAAGSQCTSVLVTDSTVPNGQYMKFTMTQTGQGGIYAYPISRLETGKKYTWSVYVKCSSNKTIHIGSEQNGNRDKNITTTWTRLSHTFTATEKNNWAFVFYLKNSAIGDEVSIHSLKIEEGELSDWCPNNEEILNNIGIEKLKYATRKIELSEPLRGLPNGIKDTIEKINGEWKIVRRCGEVIFNGSQPVTGTSNLTSNSTWSKFGYQLEDCKDYSNVVCDSLAYQTDKSGINPDLGECVGCTNNMWKILFQVKKNNNVPSTVAEVNDYMKKNPKKVIYELINPIIEDIDPVTLQCWKNGTISIIDEVIPVETTHTVSLNKSAQIQKNIEELTSLKNRVKTLEEQYSKTALNQAYETELLKLDMKLDDII